jgi:cyclase
MRKTLAIRSFGVAVALAGLWIARTQQGQPPQGLTIDKVKDDLFVISGSGGNVAAYLTNEGVILVDDKFPQNTPDIIAKVKSVSDKPIKYVLNTHQHGDHTGGNQNLLGTAEIIAHRNARANMVTQKMPGLQPITFSDEVAVWLGGKEVRAHYYGRGHTNGDAAVYFPALRVVHTGDLCVSPGPPFIDYSSGGSAVEWTKTIDGILQLDFDTVIPGHGPVIKREDLVAFRGKIETLRTRMSELKRQGTSKADAVKSLKLDDLGWKVAGLFERSIPGLYDEVR